MKTLSQPSSALAQPLDAIIGTPSAVRVLRVLATHGGVLSPGVIADRARINRAGARRTLDHLARTGIVEIVGQGRYVSYQFRERHPLGSALAAPFQAERDRVNALFDLVRQTAQAMSPPPVAVWLYGSGARGEDTIDSDLDLAVVGEDDHLQDQDRALRRALVDAGDEWAFQPSLIALSPADVRRMAEANTAFWQNLSRDAVPLFGSAPWQVAHG